MISLTNEYRFMLCIASGKGTQRRGPVWIRSQCKTNERGGGGGDEKIIFQSRMPNEGSNDCRHQFSAMSIFF